MVVSLWVAGSGDSPGIPVSGGTERCPPAPDELDDCQGDLLLTLDGPGHRGCMVTLGKKVAAGRGGGGGGNLPHLSTHPTL